MKRFGWLMLGCLLSQFTWAQAISFKQLTALLNLNQNRLETHLRKKGFKRSGFSINNDASFSKLSPGQNDTMQQCFQVVPNEEGFDLVYETTAQQEYADLQEQMKAAGFIYSTAKADTILYQKQNMVVSCCRQRVDTSLFYVIRVNKKTIPRAKDIVFAEDLLQLDSHEYIATAFGRQNVKTEWLPFSAGRERKCTIIFPNSSRQAIFIWKDEVNLRELSFVIIGEQLNNSEKATSTVILSDWRSKQGIYCGMSLKEIQSLNKEPVNFYNWRTELAGLLAPQNTGAIDFERLKPVFNCMNCGFLYVDKSRDIIQSSYALDENQKVYVAGFVVLPEKSEGGTGKTIGLK